MIAHSRLVWMNGPFRAGKSDVSIFQDKGLKAKLQSINKKAIGDRGYVGHPKECSTYNAHDCRGVRKFNCKSRALKRFACFFEAICVICQYQIEDDMPLYDVLIEDIMEED